MSRTSPDATQEYKLPSCSACLRIAWKRGIAIGHGYNDGKQSGRVEAVTHAGGEPVLMVGMVGGLLAGLLVSVPLRQFLNVS